MTDRFDVPFPHTFLPVTVRSIYVKLLAAVAPVLLVGLWRGGMPAVMVTLVAVASGAVAEFAADLFRSSETSLGTLRSRSSSAAKNGRALYMMVLLAVLLPAATPLPLVAVAAIASILIGVYLMGDVGAYYVHPIFIGLLLVAGNGVSTIPVDDSAAIAALSEAVGNSGLYRAVVDGVFVPLGMHVPADAVALLVNFGDIGAVSIGAGLFPALIVGSLLVFGEELVPPVLIVSFFVGAVAVLAITEANIIDMLVRSNILLILLFALPDPSVRPLRRDAMAIFGGVSGVLAAVLLVFDGAAVPIVTGVALVATLRPLLDLPMRRR